MIFAASRSVPHMAYIAHGATCGAVRWAYAMPVCVLSVSSRSGIVFNPSAGTITDHSQSVKDIDPYFKSQLYVENPVHRKPVRYSFYRIGRVNTKSERKIYFSAVGGIRAHNLLNLDR